MSFQSMGKSAARDVRGVGFLDRTPLQAAVEWIDAQPSSRDAENVPAVEALGRVLASSMVAPGELPATGRASVDGYALRAADTVGAGDYNPLTLTLFDGRLPDALPPGQALAIVSGATMPSGADAVLDFEHAQATGAWLEVLGSVAVGHGVEARGEQSHAGRELLAVNHRLLPADLGLLAELGEEHVRVHPKPRVRVVVAGPKTDDGTGAAARDADGPMLRGLIVRDGGVVTSLDALREEGEGLREALASTGDDIVLVAGRTGTGPDDLVPAVVAEEGELALHGIALRPGGSAGLGRVASRPVVLLPGEPRACLTAYELLAGRLIRRHAGLSRDPPYPRVEVELGRKLVSAIGYAEVVQIRLVEHRAEPIGSIEGNGLALVARAEGFVLVPPGSEGYPAGARVTAYLYDRAATA